MQKRDHGLLAALVSICVLCLPLVAGATVTGSPSSVQQILDSEYGAGIVHRTRDRLEDGTDASWTATSNASASLLFEFAGFREQNVFGIYDAGAPEAMLSLFEGADSGGARTTLSISDSGAGTLFSVTSAGVTRSAVFGGSVFGFYIKTPEDNIFYSDSNLNRDDVDHLWAYSAPANGGSESLRSSYLLMWEDLLNGGDKDFQDMVVRINGYLPVAGGPSPVPLPAGLFLLGSGLFGLAGLGRRKKAS